MKLSTRLQPSKIAIPMAPMIGVMFLVLIFFMLGLRIVSSEESFKSNLPIAAPANTQLDFSVPEIKVSLRSDKDGNLTELALGNRNLGNDDAAFDLLNDEILRLVNRPGTPLTKDVEVEIDADFECQYKYVVKAISRCTGRMDPQTNTITRYVEKIKFAPPHKPKA